MTDSRFFQNSGSFSLAQIAEITGAVILDETKKSLEFSDVASLDRATEKDISFFESKSMEEEFKVSKAGACFVKEEFAKNAPDGMCVLVSEEPHKAYAVISTALFPVLPPKPQIHPKATVADSAEIESDVCIKAGAYVGENVIIGHRCLISPNAVIDDNVVIGDDCIIGACATISHCIMGDKVNIYPGARIGQDGFGFIMSEEGHYKIPQLGRVIIGDDVEIGANTCIDRGASNDTVIGSGCRMDNFVQIAHNVEIGSYCVLVSQMGISGSSKVGDFVAIGGQVGIAEHINIGNGARIAAQSGVMRDISAGATVMGTPAIPMKEYMRQVAMLGKMSRKKSKK